MIPRKIFAGSSPVKQKVRRYILYQSRKRASSRAWQKRHTELFRKNPAAKADILPESLQEHRRIWKRFWRNVPADTYTICHAISGGMDPFIIPEEIYHADIEPSLNRDPRAHFIAHKSYYGKWFADCGFPNGVLHKLNGLVLDSSLNRISHKQLGSYVKSLTYPLLLKPSMDSNGGTGIICVKNPGDLKPHIKKSDNFVVQEIIRQHDDLGVFHPESVNTVRIYLYRSVKDNEAHIINRVLRAGTGGLVDNVSSGGIVCLISETGSLNGYALDKFGRRYQKHPVTGVSFKGSVPKLEELDQLARHIFQQLHYVRVVGLDLCYDVSGKWRCLEINTRSHSIRFAQYPGQPFFGEFTEEVIEYCKDNHWALTV